MFTQDKKTYTAYIYEKADSSMDFNECIARFIEISSENFQAPQLDIIANNNIDKLDLSFVGHLILMKKAIPALSINIILPYDANDRCNDNKQNSFLWKIRQSMVHAQLTTNEKIFNIYDSDGRTYNTDHEMVEWFVLSKKFIPTIYLNEKNYCETFEAKSNFIDISILKSELNHVTEIFKSGVSEEKIFQSCRKYLYSNKTNNNYLQILSQLSFYRSLKDLKILRYYLIKYINLFKCDELQVSNVKNIKLKNAYWEKILPIYEELHSKPPIFHLIFSTLTSSSLINSKICDEEIETEGDKLYNLWGFTKELVYGLNELAKNIIQHSTKKQGIISGYIDENEDFRINVFDYGSKCIVNTLKKSTLSASDNAYMNEVFKDDYKKLESHEYKLPFLFEFNEEYFLNQQTKRATAHLGLLIFTRLIIENNGRLIVSSSDPERKDDVYLLNHKDKGYSNIIPIGTNYQIHLPTLKEHKDIYSDIITPDLQSADNTLSVEELLFFEENDNISNTNKIINIIIHENDDLDSQFEMSIWSFFSSAFKQELKKQVPYNQSKTKNIVCVSFGNFITKINASQLFRFLGKWEVEYPLINLIVYDITSDLYSELINVNKAFLYNTKNNELPFWNSSSITLFYSFLMIDQKSKFYFTDALWGDNVEDFKYINSLIRKNNYNALPYHSECEVNINAANKKINNEFFYKGNTLLPFDLLIISNNSSLFEINTKTLLCNELKDIDNQIEIYNNKNTNIKNQILNYSGFKISNSHFRLGSKIHISDFYYAKKLFQNSYYASKFAFVIAKYIIKKHLMASKNNKVQINELSLIGYGLYSELLLSLIVKFIVAYNKNNGINLRINHNLFTDTEEMNLVKGYESVYKNFIVIVPIASTFLTSIKIEEKIQNISSECKELIQKKNILEPYINVLVISNGELELKNKIDDNCIEKKYGWNKVDNINKIITVTSFFDNQYKDQKYFLSLASKWYSVEECEICSPQINGESCVNKKCNKIDCENYCELGRCPLAEKPLLVTDKTSVTPALIFGYPKAREIKEKDKKRKFSLSSESLVYGHIARNNHHFHYHIFDERFLLENNKNDEVNNWLYEVKDEIMKLDSINIKSSDNVLLIAPKHFSNTGFINIVNEILFSNSANILHYDFWNNSVDNFQVFYYNVVNDADKILFIDDSIISGSTFMKSNDFIKETRINKNAHGFDSCIFLINRSNYFTQNNIIRKLASKNRLFSFANLHLPLLEGDGNRCQLCLDVEKERQLFFDSFLGRFKHTFQKKIKKNIVKDVSAFSGKYKSEEKPFENSKQQLIKVEAIHRIYEYFQNKNNQEIFINEENVDVWLSHFIAATKSPFSECFIERNSVNNDNSTTIADIILKVLSSPPFNMYRPIKEKVFGWTIKLLNEKVEILKNNNFKDFDYSDFRYLKYMIRRTGLIHSNYLISSRFINFLCDLYNSNWLLELKSNAMNEIDLYKVINKDGFFDRVVERQKSIINNIDDFTDYIVAQIKELLYQNESRSIILEKRIRNKLNLSQTSCLDQLLRVILEENGILISRFWEFYNIKNTPNLSQLSTQKHYQYNLVCDFFCASNEREPEKNLQFQKYIEIKDFLTKDKDGCSNNKHESLEKKTAKICDLLQELLFDNNVDTNNGAFLLVNYKIQSEPFLAYNSGSISAHIANSWHEPSNFIVNFISGIKNSNEDYFITIDILTKDINNNWESLYASKYKVKIEYLATQEDVRYILIVRLSIKMLDDEEEIIPLPKGVIVFYSDSQIFSITKTRYILLLKESISNFINSHHNTNEFRDWIDKSRQLQYISTINHDVDVYRNAFYKICNRIKNKNIRISLEIVWLLMLNKQLIIKFVNDYEECGDVFKVIEINNIEKALFKREEIEERIRKYVDCIFSFENNTYNKILSGSYVLSFGLESQEDIEIFPVFFDEIIFELIYNIRKRYSDYIPVPISSKNMLELYISFSQKEIIIVNNQASLILTDEKVSDINNKINDRTKTKGLNLINSLTKILFSDNIYVAFDGDDKFSITIPLQ